MKNNITILALSCLFVSFGCKKEPMPTAPTNPSTPTNPTDPNPPAPTYTFPTLSIFTENEAAVTSREEYIQGNSIKIRPPFSVDTLGEMKIRGRGNSTWAFPKKPYQIKFDDKTAMFGMPEDKRWVLLANYSDKTMLRNELGFELSRISDLEWTPESRFVELDINNDFKGTYQITQKIEESKNRLDIGDDGFLLEVDQLARLNDDDVYFKTDNFLYNIKEPEVDFDDSQYTAIEDYLVNFEKILFSTSFKDPQYGYAGILDVESFIDWYIIHEIAKNNDANFHSSVFMYLRPGEKLKMGPVWDFDIAFGNINYNGQETPQGFWMKNGLWAARLFEDPVFADKVKTRYAYFYDRKNDILNSIDTNAAALLESQQRNDQRWNLIGTYVWPNYVNFETYNNEVNYLKLWLSDRMDWLYDAL